MVQHAAILCCCSSVPPEQVQIVTCNADIKSVADLKGDSVWRCQLRRLLQRSNILGAYGIDVRKATSPLYTRTSLTPLIPLKNGKVDAAFIVAGAPTTAITDLSTSKASWYPWTLLTSLSSRRPLLTMQLQPFPLAPPSGMDADTTTVSVLCCSCQQLRKRTTVTTSPGPCLDGAQNNADAHAHAETSTLEPRASITSVPYHAGAASTTRSRT